MGKDWQSAERDVAGKLQEWWRQVEPEATLARTPGSGSYATSRRDDDFGVAGDVHAGRKTKLWPFSVEVKWWAKITPRMIELFIAGLSKTLDKHWCQTVEAAHREGKQPLYVFRGNRMAWWCSFFDPALGGRLRVCLLDELLARDPREFLAKRAKVGGDGKRGASGEDRGGREPEAVD